jgi:hypothetical protein
LQSFQELQRTFTNNVAWQAWRRVERMSTIWKMFQSGLNCLQAYKSHFLLWKFYCRCNGNVDKILHQFISSSWSIHTNSNFFLLPVRFLLVNGFWNEI